MITLEQYVGKLAKSLDWTPKRQANARRLLACCEKLETIMLADHIVFHDNPVTGNGVSGEQYGGFRPQSCTIGAPRSNHKEGLAVDRYDPDGKIDEWCLAHLEELEECGIWLESPEYTKHWSHWQCVSPKSGRRIFIP